MILKINGPDHLSVFREKYSTESARLSIGGIIGQYLDVDNAIEIGLLPSMPGVVETSKKTALAGCEALLLSPDGRTRKQEEMARAVSINLAACDDFERLFMEHLFLMPITGDERP